MDQPLVALLEEALRALGDGASALRARVLARLQELVAPLQGFVVQYPAIPAWRSALASLYSDLGRDAEARGEFERLAAHDFTGSRCSQKSVPSWLIRAAPPRCMICWCPMLSITSSLAMR